MSFHIYLFMYFRVHRFCYSLIGCSVSIGSTSRELKAKHSSAGHVKAAAAESITRLPTRFKTQVGQPTLRTYRHRDK